MNLPSSQKTVAIIPARYSSTRFPGKPLADIAGKPMIQHVWERAKQTPSIDQILVATDDERILNTVRNFGGEGILTSTEHETGTDRIVEVAEEIESLFAPLGSIKLLETCDILDDRFRNKGLTRLLEHVFLIVKN